MNDTKHVELVLRWLVASMTVIGVLALLWPVSAPSAELAPVVARAAEKAAVPFDRADTEPVAAANIFSPTRSAPRQRYTPYWEEPVGQAAEVTPPRAENQARAVSDTPVLFGIVQGDKPSALLRVDAAGAQLYHVGDRAGAYRVVSIDEQSVVLSGSAGRLVLRLNRNEEP